MPETPDHYFRILIVGSSGSGKTNAILNLIIHKPDIDKIYLYAKIHTNQNVNFWLINVKMLEQRILKTKGA